MSFRYSVSRILHDDHEASLAFLVEADRIVLARKAVPARHDEEVVRFARRLCAALAGEIGAHFDFEEEALFPLLSEFGDGDLAELLTEEHRTLREVFDDLRARTEAATADGFADESWAAFRGVCGELAERMRSHIDKEERALLPSLENALTPETDAELSARHNM